MKKKKLKPRRNEKKKKFFFSSYFLLLKIVWMMCLCAYCPRWKFNSVSASDLCYARIHSYWICVCVFFHPIEKFICLQNQDAYTSAQQDIEQKRSEKKVAVKLNLHLFAFYLVFFSSGCKPERKIKYSEKPYQFFIFLYLWKLRENPAENVCIETEEMRCHVQIDFIWNIFFFSIFPFIELIKTIPSRYFTSFW